MNFYSTSESEVPLEFKTRKSQINYENNRVIDGSLDLGSDKYSMSLTSSIRGIASKYVANVLIIINDKINDLSRSGSKNSSTDFKIELVQQNKNKIETDSVVRVMISESDSASVADFDKVTDDGKHFAQVCTDKIDAKVRDAIKAMTGVESAFNNNKIEIGVNMSPSGRPRPSEDFEMINREHRGTPNSSINLTPGAATVAKDYLTDLFTTATKQIDEDLNFETENYNKNEIEFIREVTEESLKDESKNSNYLLF
jgi:hypothetical protein